MYQPSHVSSSHESIGATAGTSRGTTITAAGAANTKGSYADIGANTTSCWEALTICMSRNTAADHMIDIALGEAGSEAIIIPDLYYSALRLNNGHNTQITLPIHVPSGSQIRARIASSVASSTAGIAIIGHCSGVGGAPGFSRAVTLFTPASSRGVAIDPGGVANTEGTWAVMTASSPADIAGMFGLIGFNGDVARAAAQSMLVDIGLGAAASEYVLYPNALLRTSTVLDGPFGVRIPAFACAVPAATRIVARAQSSSTTAGDRTVDLALYGFVA